MASLLAVRHAPLTEAQMHGMRTEERKAREPRPLHMGSYYSEHVTHTPWGKQPDSGKLAGYEYNASLWNVDGARPVRDAFATGAAEIAALIRLDGDRAVAATGPKAGKAMVAHSFLQPIAVKGSLVQRAQARSLVAEGENLRWIDDRQFKQ
jgi:hypothetical protein